MKTLQGDPQIVQRRCQIHREMVKGRLSVAVPKANVVITNPTHYAVALRYETGMGAPLVVAKGGKLRFSSKVDALVIGDWPAGAMVTATGTLDSRFSQRTLRLSETSLVFGTLGLVPDPIDLPTGSATGSPAPMAAATPTPLTRQPMRNRI